MSLLYVALAGFLTALAGCMAVALWKGGGRLTAALVEIARLPAVVDRVVDRLDTLADLVARVDRIEAHVIHHEGTPV